jgi:hypothetical protein
MPALSQYSSPMTTNRGRELNFVLRFSSRSTATLGSDIMIVGRRPIHNVKIGPYTCDHFSNWIHGEEDGIMSLFPMKGRGVGPGGRRRYNRKSCISIEISGRNIKPTAEQYGCEAKNCGMEEIESFPSNADNAILRSALRTCARKLYFWRMMDVPKFEVIFYC